MNVLIALTACQAGAAIANYVSVNSITHDSSGKANGAVVTDTLPAAGGKPASWTIRAKSVINATGPFGDAVRLLDDPKATPLITGASGMYVDWYAPPCVVLI